MPSENWTGGTLKHLREDLPTTDRALAAALRAAFTAMGISLRSFAQLLFSHPATVSRYLSGHLFPPEDFIEKVVDVVGHRLTAADVANLRCLHEEARRGRNDAENKVRTLTAQISRKDAQALADARRHREYAVALDRAHTEIRGLKIQIRLATGSLGDPSVAVLEELERYARLRAAGARDAVTCVSPGTLRKWRTMLDRFDRTSELTGTDSKPCTPERRRASYRLLELDQAHRDALDDLVPVKSPRSVPPGEEVVELHALVLGAMRVSGPRPLTKALAHWSQEQPSDLDTSQFEFRGQLTAGKPADPLVELWRRAVTEWDFAEAPNWTGSAARSAERRIAAYELLALEPESRRVLTELVPISFTEGPIVISTAFVPWLTPARESSQAWYWPAYEGYLRQVKGWPTEAVAGVDEAARRVVERLADPTAAAAYQAKGLVVGYVQSGKTAHITGVVAKAVDSGYRLVIVLSGSLNNLRAQTQRRLDKELVGRENILRGAAEEDGDYADDPAWRSGEFLTHGRLPSRIGGFDIVRLTTRDSDYRLLHQGITALEFEKAHPSVPLHDPRNLHRSAARLMVVKKNSTVLRKVVKDLRSLGDQLREIPVLIVDDEADHGSVNTMHPGRFRENGERTAINGLISQLLGLLPRAQYIAYTATPFANVLIDPADTEDIFPKDFVISLPRPAGYMGARDFHDFDTETPPQERTVANSQEMAHVRAVYDTAAGGDSALRQALDAFVLSGAVKLYREAHDPSGIVYRHHTMLVHESVRIADHRELAKRVLRLWYEPDESQTENLARLRALHDQDFAPVSAHRAGTFVVPATFDELIPYVDAARARVTGAGDPTVVVNGDKDIEAGTVDFDRRRVWKILVGGAKLARGFTIEGLTVTYYRRATSQADALMQMGRWFGFREGYRDLVRLYIGRGETAGRSEIDLYEAFEAMCRDEEAFRVQLTEYARLVNGHPQVTPAQLPPLVAQHLPWLRPTSPNKMYNAELVEIHSPGTWIEPGLYPVTAVVKRRNTELWRAVLEALHGPLSTFAVPADNSGHSGSFSAHTIVVGHTQMLDVLSGLKWASPGHFAPHLAYLQQTSGNHEGIDDWLVIVPHPAKARVQVGTVLGSPTLSVLRHDRLRAGPPFGRISSPLHRRVAQGLVADTRERRGITLLYPVLDARDIADQPERPSGRAIDPSGITLAFALLPPGVTRDRTDSAAQRLYFRVRDASAPDSPIVDKQ